MDSKVQFQFQKLTLILRKGPLYIQNKLKIPTSIRYRQEPINCSWFVWKHRQKESIIYQNLYFGCFYIFLVYFYYKLASPQNACNFKLFSLIAKSQKCNFTQPLPNNPSIWFNGQKLPRHLFLASHIILF